MRAWQRQTASPLALSQTVFSPPTDFSAGTKEDWRADADDFPVASLGEALGDWEGEVWVDVNNEVSKVMAYPVGGSRSSVRIPE